MAVAALRTIHLDQVFMGVHGMDPRSGFTTPNVLEADTDRALVASGRRLIVLADASKWGVIGISAIARLEEADTLVSDEGLDDAARAYASEHVRELVIAPGSEHAADDRGPAEIIRIGTATAGSTGREAGPGPTH